MAYGPKPAPPEIPAEPKETIRNEKYAAITRRITAAVEEQEERLTDYCEVSVTIQAGRPVLTRITTTHKPTNQEASEPKVWLNMSPWDACAEDMPTEAQLRERACVGGLDLSNLTGIASFVLYFPASRDGSNKAAVRPYFWIPVDSVDDITERYHWPIREWERAGYVTVMPGSVIDRDFITAAILELRQPFCIIDMGYDPWSAAQLAQDLNGKGMTVTEVRQGMATLNEPVKELRRLVLTKRIAHGGNPVLRAMVSSLAMVTDAHGNERPDAKQSAGPISGVTALLNAMAVAAKYPSK